jgi:TM2 domain-containing membrane protein YozV
MKKKSKFLAFILSIVPGLGQIYLGHSTRGAVFLSTCIGIPTLILIVRDMSRWWIMDGLILALFAMLWVLAMLDSMIIADRINNYVDNMAKDGTASLILPDYKALAQQNKKVIAMLLSIIPGAGHMYIGLQRQGIELMAAFFLAFYLTDWIKVSLFMVFAPIIWFASIFDVMHKAAGDRPMKDDKIFSDKWFNSDEKIISEKSFLRNKHKVLGYCLVFIGAMFILNRILFPLVYDLLDYRIRENLQTGIVAVLLIAGGIRLLIGSKSTSLASKEEVVVPKDV